MWSSYLVSGRFPFFMVIAVLALESHFFWSSSDDIDVRKHISDVPVLLMVESRKMRSSIFSRKKKHIITTFDQMMERENEENFHELKIFSAVDDFLFNHDTDRKKTDEKRRSASEKSQNPAKEVLDGHFRLKSEDSSTSQCELQRNANSSRQLQPSTVNQKIRLPPLKGASVVPMKPFIDVQSSDNDATDVHIKSHGAEPGDGPKVAKSKAKKACPRCLWGIFDKIRYKVVTLYLADDQVKYLKDNTYYREDVLGRTVRPADYTEYPRRTTQNDFHAAGIEDFDLDGRRINSPFVETVLKIPLGSEIFKVNKDLVTDSNALEKMRSIEPPLYAETRHEYLENRENARIELRYKSSMAWYFGFFILGLNHFLSFIAWCILANAYNSKKLKWYRATDCNSTDLGYSVRNDSQIFFDDNANLSTTLDVTNDTNMNFADYEFLLSNLKYNSLYVSTSKTSLLNTAVVDGCVTEGFFWHSGSPWPAYMGDPITYCLAGLIMWLSVYATGTFVFSKEYNSVESRNTRAQKIDISSVGRQVKLVQKMEDFRELLRQRIITIEERLEDYYDRTNDMYNACEEKQHLMVYDNGLRTTRLRLLNESNRNKYVEILRKNINQCPEYMRKRLFDNWKKYTDPEFTLPMNKLHVFHPTLFQFKSVLVFTFLNIPMMAFSGVVYAVGCESFSPGKSISRSSFNGTNASNPSFDGVIKATPMILNNVWNCHKESLMDSGLFQVDKVVYVCILASCFILSSVFLFAVLWLPFRGEIFAELAATCGRTPPVTDGLKESKNAGLKAAAKPIHWNKTATRAQKYARDPQDYKYSQRAAKFSVKSIFAILIFTTVCGLARAIKGLSIYDTESYWRAFVGGNFGFFRGKILDAKPSPLDDIDALAMVLWLQGITSFVYIFKSLFEGFSTTCEF